MQGHRECRNNGKKWQTHFYILKNEPHGSKGANKTI